MDRHPGWRAKISDGSEASLPMGKNDRTECRCSPLRANLKYGYVCPPFVTEARYSINVRDINTREIRSERTVSERKEDPLNNCGKSNRHVSTVLL